jgi:hypothetical protein
VHTIHEGNVLNGVVARGPRALVTLDTKTRGASGAKWGRKLGRLDDQFQTLGASCREPHKSLGDPEPQSTAREAKLRATSRPRSQNGQ